MEICKIMTTLALEPLAAQMTSEQPENPLPNRENQFFCSPADILVYRKVDLRDAEVSGDVQRRFQDLCTRYSKFFSNDLGRFWTYCPINHGHRDTGQSAYLKETL